MPDLDGGMYLVETDISGSSQDTNSTLQRVGAFDLSVACWVEPPASALATEEHLAAWMSFLCGTLQAAALQMPNGGVLRFHVQIGPAENL